jgi:hypothetical protein
VHVVEKVVKATYHLLTELGVGIFAECVGHFEVGWLVGFGVV